MAEEEAAVKAAAALSDMQTIKANMEAAGKRGSTAEVAAALISRAAMNFFIDDMLTDIEVWPKAGSEVRDISRGLLKEDLNSRRAVNEALRGLCTKYAE